MALPDDISIAKQLGGAYYITKPVNERKLLARVSEKLSRKNKVPQRGEEKKLHSNS